MIDGGATLARRLDRYRSAIRAPARDAAAPPIGRPRGPPGDGGRRRDRPDVRGVIVRLETPSRAMPVDRALLATLPGQPPADVPLVCLDTETTGLATAAGTLAWLDRGRLVGGGPFPPGPAPLAGQRRGALPAGRARGDDPRRRPGSSPTTGAASTGRCWWRATGSRAGPPRSTPVISTCCPSSGACSVIGWPTLGFGPPRRSCSGSIASATSRAGRSPGATSSSSAAGRPSRSSTSSATTTRTSARWLAC